MKTTLARSGFVLPSIESVSLIDLDEAPLSACALPEACFAVGTDSGRLLVFQSEGDLLGVSEFGSSVIGLVASGDSVVAATSLDGVTALQGETKWTVDVSAGCEIIVGSGDGVLLADGAGAVSHMSSEGEMLGREVHGEVTGLASNADGSVTAIALSDGRVIPQFPAAHARMLGLMALTGEVVSNGDALGLRDVHGAIADGSIRGRAAYPQCPGRDGSRFRGCLLRG